MLPNPNAMIYNRAGGIALEIYAAVLKAVGPERIIAGSCQLSGSVLQIASITSSKDSVSLDLDRFRNVYVCGAGKASYGLAWFLRKLLGDRVTGGLVVTKHGHSHYRHGLIRFIEAAHPVPDRSSQSAGEAMLGFARRCGPDDLVLFLLSGGASSLIEVPEPDIDLLVISEVTQLMLAGGANIHELNAVRTGLSRIKGGKLAAAFGDATVVCLVLSDVVGDDLSVIGSGPLWTRSPTRGAFLIAQKFEVDPLLPQTALERLKSNLQGSASQVQHLIIGNSELVGPAVLKATADLGIRVLHAGWIRGEARWEAVEIVQKTTKNLPPSAAATCLYATGEPVVTVTGKGKGGRCQEFACAAAALIEGRDDIAVLAGSTDGTDGPTDAAGGLVDGGSVARGAANGWKVADALHDNNSYVFLEACDGLIRTGPTQSNVNDLFLVVRA